MEESNEPPAKRLKVAEEGANHANVIDLRSKGCTPIKAEYLLTNPALVQPQSITEDDDAEYARFDENPRSNRPENSKRGDRSKKSKGANYGRKHGTWQEKVQLCSSRMYSNELSPEECAFETCRYEHDLRKYMVVKTEDLKTYDVCPLYSERGWCPAGWKCRFLSSHSQEVDHEDGKKELVLLKDDKPIEGSEFVNFMAKNRDWKLYNVIDSEQRIKFQKKQISLQKAENYTKWLDEWGVDMNKASSTSKVSADSQTNGSSTNGDLENGKAKQDHSAGYKEPPFRPSEKRRIYYGPETPTLAPLTTQGNLPFRRLCLSLGAEFTFSEMAMTVPILQGTKGEMALLKAHESEIIPPSINSSAQVVQGYEHTKDLRFGVQVSANKHWAALKGAELLSTYLPHLRVIDLNCGCPIDLVCKSGGGSQLLEQPSKLEKILRGMVAVSGEVPITCKIRMGVKDIKPNADKVVERLVLGSDDFQAAGLGPPGIAAITLHGRTKQQRYSKSANWGYISEIGALIKRLQQKKADVLDTVKEVDARDLPNGGKTFFLGNGDVFSHIDYNEHISQHQVDAVMIGRGALIKPWIFEEIKTGQYLDKSSSERLEYIRQFVKYGLDTWGSDEMGAGTTRRFLMEWLSFTHRYVPIGLLEVLPPRINDRPPAFRGRDELETLMASDNVHDWAKIADMFLGKAPDDFKFVPKHKSNAYETAETQG